MTKFELMTNSGKYALRFDCEDPDQVFVESSQHGDASKRISIRVLSNDREEMLEMLKSYLMEDAEEGDEAFKEVLNFFSVRRTFHVIDFRSDNMDKVEKLYKKAKEQGCNETLAILHGNPTLEDLGVLQAAIVETRDDSTVNTVAVAITDDDGVRLGIWY